MITDVVEIITKRSITDDGQEIHEHIEHRTHIEKISPEEAESEEMNNA